MTPLDPISVVVTTYNRSEALIAVLVGLAAQDDKDFELVIADDGSLPHHVQAVERAVLELGIAANMFGILMSVLPRPESVIWGFCYPVADISFF